MLITKDFVMLNFPKTGSSFARQVIKKVYSRPFEKSIFMEVVYKLGILHPKFIELILPNIKMPFGNRDQHGTYSQIPSKYLNRNVISVVRNPYTRFFSIYQFKEWSKDRQLLADREFIEQKFSNFPNVSIDEFIELCYLDEKKRLSFIKNSVDNPNDLGFQTIQFVQMFFKDPKTSIFKFNDDYIFSGDYKKDIGSIKFLRQENLRDDLKKLLLSFGYNEKSVQIINNFKKINVTKSGDSSRNELSTSKVMNYITKRERYLVHILKDHGIFYDDSVIH